MGLCSVAPAEQRWSGDTASAGMLEPVSRVTVRTPVRRFHNGVFTSRPDVVAGEEPLEIRIGGRSLTVTMRTPGHDIELVHGFLHAEGLIAAADDISEIRYCDGVDEQGRNTYNVLDVTLSPTATSPTATSPTATTASSAVIPARSFTTTSACGVCGTASIEGLQRRMRYRLTDLPAFAPTTIIALPDRLRARQQAFRTTGGVHAAALVNPDGQLDHLREDVGRHNAVDKVIGTAVMAHELPDFRPCPAHVVAGFVRARAKGGDGRHRDAGRGVGAIFLGGAARRGDRAHPHRVHLSGRLQHLFGCQEGPRFGGLTTGGHVVATAATPWCRHACRQMGGSQPIGASHEGVSPPTAGGSSRGYDHSALHRCVHRSEHEESFDRHRRTRSGRRHHPDHRRLRIFRHRFGPAESVCGCVSRFRDVADIADV